MGTSATNSVLPENSQVDVSFQKLYNCYAKSITKYVKKKVSPDREMNEVVEDIIQEVFLRAYKNMATLNEHPEPLRWLYVVANNLCNDYWRKFSRQPNNLITFNHNDNSNEDFLNLNAKSATIENNHQNDPYKQLDAQEFSSNIHKILLQLPARYYQAIFLFDFMNLSYHEAAEQLNLSVPAYTSLLKRARAKFKNLYIVDIMGIDDALLNNSDYRQLSELIELHAQNSDDVRSEINHQFLDFFERNANCYADFRRKAHMRQALDQITLELSAPKKNNVVADFGMGDGTFLCKLAPLVGSVDGFDISSQMMILAQKNINITKVQNAHIYLQDIMTMPITPEKYDIAYLQMLLHHTSVPHKILEIIAAQIKPGGTIIINDNVKHDCTNLVKEQGDLWYGFEPSYLKKLLSGLGFRKIWVETVDNLHQSSTDMAGYTAEIPIFIMGATKKSSLKESSK